jgi:cytochrome c556
MSFNKEHEMQKALIVCFTVAAVSIGALAGADGHISDKQIETAVKARKAHMQLYSFHLATLGGMAKEEIPYDADTAAAAADSIAALSGLSQAGYWLPGSDNASIEDTRALPAIWEDGSDVGAKAGAFVEAALLMQTAAPTGLAALQGAMGPLGTSCGGCHQNYRQSNN